MTVLAMAVAIKVLVLAYGAIAYQILLNRPVVGWRGFLLLWNQWDAPHYIDLARLGYQEEGEVALYIVFFPLFPWMTRLASYITGDLREGAFLVSTVASLTAAVLLYRLVAVDHPRECAIQSAFFFFIFPTSLFLHIGYTESLFLALTIGSFLAARTGHWPAAGVLGAAACLARANGLILLPALAVEAYLQWRHDQRWRWEWLAIGLVGVGMLGYLALNWRVTGDPLRFLDIQREHFREEAVMPWESFEAARRSIARGPEEGQTLGYQQILFGLIAFAGVLASARWLRPSYTVWMLGTFWLLANHSFPRSTPRYVLLMFPLFILLAWAAERRLANVVITVWSLLFLALFTATFVQGKWLA